MADQITSAISIQVSDTIDSKISSYITNNETTGTTEHC